MTPLLLKVADFTQESDPQAVDRQAEMAAAPDGQTISLGALPGPESFPVQNKVVAPPPPAMMTPDPTMGAVPPPPPQPQAPAPQPPQVQVQPPMAPQPQPPMAPKAASFIDQLAHKVVKRAFFPQGYGGNPMGGMGPMTGNQFGFPGQAVNYGAGLNSSYFPPPGVGQYGYGRMGPAPMSEATLKANYERELERIKNLAGQRDPASGKLYTPDLINRMTNDLNTQTSRSLSVMRQSGGSGGQPGAPAFGGQSFGGPGFASGSMPHGLPGWNPGYTSPMFTPATGVPFGGSPFGGSPPGVGPYSAPYNPLAGFNPSMPFGAQQETEPEEVAKARQLLATQKGKTQGSAGSADELWARNHANQIELNKAIIRGASKEEVESLANNMGLMPQLRARQESSTVLPSAEYWKPFDVDNDLFGSAKTEEGDPAAVSFESSGKNHPLRKVTWGVNGTKGQQYVALMNMSPEDRVKYLLQQRQAGQTPQAPPVQDPNSPLGQAQATVDAHTKAQQAKRQQEQKIREYNQNVQLWGQHQQNVQWAQANNRQPPPPPPGLAEWASGGGTPASTPAATPPTTPATPTPASPVPARPAAAPGGPAVASATPPTSPSPASPPGTTEGASVASVAPTTSVAPPEAPPSPHVAAPAAGAVAGVPVPHPTPGLGMFPGSEKGARLTRPSVTQLAKMAARDLEKTGSPAHALKTLAMLMGGGTLAGAGVGAATAPQDYMVEGGLRGARMGLLAGAGAGAGGMLGKATGKGLSAVGNRFRDPAKQQLIPAKALGAAGEMAGAGLGGLGAVGFDAHSSGPTPWERGDLPLTEQFENQMRRKTPMPSFKLASEVLKKMGFFGEPGKANEGFSGMFGDGMPKKKGPREVVKPKEWVTKKMKVC